MGKRKNANSPAVPSEQPDDALLRKIDDGELCEYVVGQDGQLVERIVRPGRRSR